MKLPDHEKKTMFRIKFGDNAWKPWTPAISHYGEWELLTAWKDEPEGKPVLAIKTGKTVRQWRLP